MEIIKPTPKNPPRPALLSSDEGSFAYTSAIYRLEIEEKNKEGKEIMDSIAGLKYQLQRRKKLIPIEDDGESDIDDWNYVFHKYFEGEDWYSATWLFTECYLYRRIRSIFAKTKHWHDYDPFFRQKLESFKASINSIIEISKLLISLWGNSTDLSLLPNLNYEDIKRLQNTGENLLKESEKNILANDLDKVWNVISKYRKTRIDFILDNA
ncbi:7126_t:CDS:2, partial [Diversispora eburnea]